MVAFSGRAFASTEASFQGVNEALKERAEAN